MRVIRSMLGLALLLNLLVIAACGDGATGGEGEVQGRLIVTGSSTVAPLVGEIARRFEQKHPGVRIDVQAGGSSQAVADVQRGTAGLGMISRSLAESERHLDATTIARDGIVLIVHRDNPIDALSDEQVVDIFTGRVRNWKDAGGDDGRITVVNKADGRATLAIFLDHYELQSRDIKPGVVIGDNQQGIRTVAGDPHAISYVSIGTATFEASRGTAIRMPRIDGQEPTLEAVHRGEYALARPLNLITHGSRSALAEAFIAFASSPEVHDLVEAQYFVPAVE